MKNFIITLITISLATLSAHAIKTDELKWHDASNLPVLGTLEPDATKNTRGCPTLSNQKSETISGRSERTRRDYQSDSGLMQLQSGCNGTP